MRLSFPGAPTAKDEGHVTVGRFWDEELDALTALAEAVHGEQAVLDAVDRALRSFVNSPTPISDSDFRNVLKAALRPLVTPH